MSSASCVKKLNCNAKAAAVAAAADRIVFEQVVPVMLASTTAAQKKAAGEALIQRFIANDEAYLSEHEEIVSDVMAWLSAPTPD